MATVTNKARSLRIFATVAGQLVSLAPGQTAEIDVAASHPVHDAWVAAGHVDIVHAEPGTATDPAAGMDAEMTETKHVGKRQRTAHVG